MSNREELLEKKLKDALEELRVFKSLSAKESKEKVVLRHSGYAPPVHLKLLDGKTVILSRKPVQSKAVVEYDDYLTLKNNTDFISKGYIYADVDDNEDNPNLILDVESWFKGHTEAKIKKAIPKIDSIATLNMLHNFTEGKNTGKYLLLRDLAAKRLSDLLNAEIVEDG